MWAVTTTAYTDEQFAVQAVSPANATQQPMLCRSCAVQVEVTGLLSVLQLSMHCSDLLSL